MNNTLKKLTATGLMHKAGNSLVFNDDVPLCVWVSFFNEITGEIIERELDTDSVFKFKNKNGKQFLIIENNYEYLEGLYETKTTIIDLEKIEFSIKKGEFNDEICNY